MISIEVCDQYLDYITTIEVLDKPVNGLVIEVDGHAARYSEGLGVFVVHMKEHDNG